ncbi:MAG: hypothetical protein IBX62_09840 [Coriobacteriia bacterium]|nr:hypothetical protein [Coriobacteriia bacterium]
MSENTLGQNKTLMYLLIAVAVLLVAVIGVLVAQSRSGVPAPDPAATGQAAEDAAANSPQPPQGGGEFDAATATKVPAGKTPEEFLKGYYEAVKSGDYAAAYECLPAANKANQDEKSFGEQLAGYGITGYSMDEPTTEGDEMTIVAYQETGFGNFGTAWTFVKDGDAWLVKGKAMAGMK